MSTQTHTLWTHGHSLVVENASQYSSVLYRGWGATLTFNTPGQDDDETRVCHIALPCPPTINKVTPQLVKLYVLFEASTNVILPRLDLWDANDLIESFNHHPEFEPAAGLWVGTGSQLSLGRNNQLPLPTPKNVSHGLGLSISCSLFSVPGLTLTVAAVGAEFTVTTGVVTNPLPPAPTHIPR